MGTLKRTMSLSLDLEIEYNYKPGAPEQGPTYSHGGLPADPPDVEVVKIMCGVMVVDHDALSREEQDEIYDAICESENDREQDGG